MYLIQPFYQVPRTTKVQKERQVEQTRETIMTQMIIVTKVASDNTLPKLQKLLFGP